MNILKVMLWGNEIGRLVWDSAKRTTYFMFNPECADIPDIAPLILPINKRDISIPSYGDSRRLYQGLPPFIADSLPDSWGNKLFDKWIRHNHISRGNVTPLYKLMFIGKRGMGALEFEPAAKELKHTQKVDLQALYNMSLEIMNERENIRFDASDNITLHTLLAMGTSAGGRQMKVIVALNPSTGEIRSGQIDGLAGFDYCIIKFEDEIMPSSEIEMAYHDMAIDCGIEMEKCALFKIEGIYHFLTHRFDRKAGKKVHTQTLAAINPEADSYEDIFATCRSLALSEQEINQMFRRLVFNVLSNNTDDHNKNISFILEEGKKWKLAPAYDLTFIFNRHGNGPDTYRCMSIYGKTEDISCEDLLYFAKENNIRNGGAIIEEIARVLSKFPLYAERYGIPFRWGDIIHRSITNNLRNFGFITDLDRLTEFTGSSGRVFSLINVSTNSKGYYEVSATVNGKKRRRFIKPDTVAYSRLLKFETGELGKSDTVNLFEEIFSD